MKDVLRPSTAVAVSMLVACTSLAWGASRATESRSRAAATIKSCVNKRTGVMRNVPPRRACRRSERALRWNVAGAAGQRGAQGPPGPPGPQGTPGASASDASVNGVPAGGDLTGAYPNPAIAPNAVDGAKVADGSLGSADLGSLAGVQLGLSTIQQHGIGFGGEFALFRSATQTLTATGNLRVRDRELSVRQGLSDRITLRPDGKLVFNQNNGSGTIELLEQISDPSAPAAQRALLYLRDNGSGDSQLVVEWDSGVVSTLATEP